VIGAPLGGGSKGRLGLSPAALPLERKAELEMAAEAAGVERDGGAVLGLRVLELALLEEGIPEVEPRRHTAWGQRHRGPECGLGLGGPPLLGERDAQRRVRRRAGGIARDDVARQPLGLDVAPFLAGEVGTLEQTDQLVHGPTVGTGREGVKRAADGR
jgi:hypothetical protein